MISSLQEANPEAHYSEYSIAALLSEISKTLNDMGTRLNAAEQAKKNLEKTNQKLESQVKLLNDSPVDITESTVLADEDEIVVKDLTTQTITIKSKSGNNQLKDAFSTFTEDEQSFDTIEMVDEE